MIVEHAGGAEGSALWAAPMEAARLAASLLGADARVACVAVDAAAGCLAAPLRRLGENRAAAFADVEACRDPVEPDHLYALGSAVDLLQEGDAAYGEPPYRRPDRRAAILFLGDGRPGADPRAASQVYRLLREREWPVFAIGVGTAAGDGRAPVALETMAGATGGRFFRAATAADLVAACTAVIAGLRGPTRTHNVMPAAGGGAHRGGE